MALMRPPFLAREPEGAKNKQLIIKSADVFHCSLLIKIKDWLDSLMSELNELFPQNGAR